MVRRLLVANPGLRYLLVAQFVSEAGTWIAYVALTVAVYARTGSATWVSAVLLAGFLPSVLLAPAIGSLVDRLSRRTLLVTSDVCSALVFAALSLVGRPWLMVALVLAAGVAASVFRPALGSALPNLVRKEDLVGANAVLQTTATAGLAAGPALAGVLVATSGTGTALQVNAASFFVSAVLIARLPAARFQADRSAVEVAASAATTGFRLFARERTLRVLLVGTVLACLAGAAVNVGEILLAEQTFRAGAAGFGLLASSCGAGLVLGSWLSARALDGREPLSVYTAGLTLAAVAFGAAAVAPSIWVADLFVLLGGVGNGLLIASRTIVLQRAVADHLRGRAFAVLYGSGNAALGVGMVLAGLVGAAFGPRALWETGAALLGLAAIATLNARPILRHVRSTA